MSEEHTTPEPTYATPVWMPAPTPTLGEYEYRAVVERVVDGDTLDLEVALWDWTLPFPVMFGGLFSQETPQTLEGLDLGFKITLGFRLDSDSLTFWVLLRERFRVLGVDTPEVYGVKKEDRGPGEAASAFVKDLIPPGEQLLIRTHKGQGKYGRWLAEVLPWTPGQWSDTEEGGDDRRSLTNRIIAAGHGVAYDGGKR
jgi:endonuclease YncB( thermonuclease family)